MRKYFGFLCVSLLILFGGIRQTNANQVTVLTDSKSLYEMGLNLHYLADENGELKISDVRNSSNFKKSEKKIPNFGFTKTVYWFKGKILIDQNSNNDWLFEISYPMLDYVDIHFFQDGEKAYHTQMGDRLPFKQRDIKNPKFLVHLSKRLEKGKEVEFFIRVKTESANQVPLIIVSERQFIEEDSHELIAQGVINGGVFIMIFFNLFVFFSTRDKAYLEVVGFIGSFVFFNTALKGYAYQYFWPGFAWWANVCVPFFIGSCLFFAARLAQSLTNIHNISPKVGKVINYISYYGVVVMLLSLALPYKLSILMAISGAVIIVPGAIYCGVRGVKSGYHPARYYLIAWGGIFAGIIMLTLSKTGVIPRNAITENGFPVGNVIQAILLSFALGDKINSLQRDKESAQKEATDRLEEQVFFLKEINSTTANLCSSHDLMVMLQSATSDLIELLSVKRASIYLLDSKNTDTLKYMAHSGEQPVGSFQKEISISFGVFGKVLSSKKSYFSNEGSEDPSFIPFQNSDNQGTKNLMIVPLMDNEDVLGVVCLVDRTDGQAFEERHKNIAETITTSVQISLQNINLLKATDEKARMEKELETAKIVQEAFVPKGDPSFPGFTLTSFFQSANECGGDYWEYLNLPDKFILLIGDVTGHGTPSALITAVSASYQCTLKLMYKEFQNNLDLSPTKILERLNTVIYSSARGAFWMTFHAAVIDKKTLNMTYANAGHTFPFLFSKKEGEKVKCKSVTALGHPLGANEIWQGKTNEIQLAPGDTLIWYTDGLIECTNPDLKQIGKRYIRQFVPDKVDGPVKDICMGIIDEAFEFFDDEPPMDDITLLVGKISNDYKIEIELNTDKKSA